MMLSLFCMSLTFSMTSMVHSTYIQQREYELFKKEVNSIGYMTDTGQMTQRYISLIESQTDADVKNLLVKSFDFATRDIRYKFSASNLMSVTLKSGQKREYLSCTGFTYELFKAIGLDYPYTSSEWMVKKDKKLWTHFDLIPPSPKEGGFRPKTGDILAYSIYNPKTKKRRGHAVVVIDPGNCIAINSTSWVMVRLVESTDNSTEDENADDLGENDEEDTDIIVRDATKSGVYFQEIARDRCMDGHWKAWDRSSNKFQILLRHKKFQDDQILEEKIASDSLVPSEGATN